jgi:peptide/nickel transport system permease protein
MTDFKVVLLPTDVLLWLLIAAFAGYAWYCTRKPHLAVPWRRVFQSRMAVGSSVVLAAYLLIGVLDSLHFRPQLPQTKPDAAPAYSPETLSVLDLALTDLRTRRERTYSEPLATRLYSKEQVEIADGKYAREFPRLRNAATHLKDENQWATDVLWKVSAGLMFAAIAFLALFALTRWLKKIRPQVPWNAALVTATVILVLAGPLAALAGSYHVMGTDKVGQDVLYLSLKSVRISLVIGTITTLVLLPLGIALGIMAGYFKGWVDDVIQYVYTTLNSIPGVLLIAAALLMMQVVIDRTAAQCTETGSSAWVCTLFATAAQRADIRMLLLCAILGLTSWTGLARLLRGETLKLSQLEYIQAAHAFGVRDARVLARHILPNVMHIVIIAMVMDFSGLVLAEAVLSYVGVGVDPATTSFGTMINAARLEMGREPIVWWSLTAAFAFMFVLVLAANLFADAVRDGFDPRVRM